MTEPLYVTFFHGSEDGEEYPYQTFGPYRCVDLEGMSIRAERLEEDSNLDSSWVDVASYIMSGVDWDDGGGEGWRADLGDTVPRYVDVSIGAAATRIPYGGADA